MELLYVHYRNDQGRVSWFYFVPIGENERGQLEGLRSVSLSPKEADFVRQKIGFIESLAPEERREFLSTTLPSFPKAYMTLKPANLVEPPFRYEIAGT